MNIDYKVFKKGDVLQIEYFIPNVAKSILSGLLFNASKKLNKNLDARLDVDDLDFVLNGVDVLDISPKSFGVMDKALYKENKKILKRIKKNNNISCKRVFVSKASLKKSADGSFSIYCLCEGGFE